MRLAREWIGLALVVFGLARAALLVAHDPLVGYANQYDMHRTGACLGLFPPMAKPARYDPSPDAPQPLLRVEAPIDNACYGSTEVAMDGAVVAIAQAAHKADDGIRMQWFGYAKLVVLALTALAIAWALHGEPDAALAHGIVVAFVLCDPVVTLWFNTMYTEFAAIWGVYAAVGAIAALAFSGRGAYALATLLFAALVALAFSREQFALLPPALALAALPFLWQRSPHLAVSAFGVALVSSVISFGLMPRPSAVARANRVDTYLGILLPAASAPLRALASVGLPARCEPAIGMTWLLRRGEKLEELCPESFRIDSWAFLRLARSDADALGRSLARVAPATQELSPGVGTLAGARRVELNQLPWWLRSPLHAVVFRLPSTVYGGLLAAALAALPLALLAGIAWARPSREQGTGLLLAVLLSGTVWYALLTTVFGDGRGEASRHFLTGNLAMIAGAVTLLAAIPGLVVRWSGTAREHGFAIAASVAAFAVTIAAVTATLHWARGEPLAIGVLDVPAGKAFTPGQPLEIRGWAVEPFGVEDVEADVSGRRFKVPHGLAPPDVRITFPGYPDAERPGFATTLRAEDLARGGDVPLTVRILVRNRYGATTEIDRRRLEPAS